MVNDKLVDFRLKVQMDKEAISFHLVDLLNSVPKKIGPDFIHFMKNCFRSESMFSA